MSRIAATLCYLSLALSSLVVADAAQAACSIYIDSTTYGSTPGGGNTIAVGPTTVSCSPGVYTGHLTNLSGASINLLLQKEVGGVWTTVDSGGYVSYSGTAGNYRYVVVNSSGGTATWALDFKYPV